MPDQNTPTALPPNSLIYEEDGELTLQFNAPTIQSRMLKADPERLVLDYTRTMMGFLLLQPKPQRIVMVGLGGGSLAKYCWCKLPDCDFVAVELSAEVIALRNAFKIPPDGPRFRILFGDGADYMRDDASSADVLLIDGFDGDGQPAKLCSTAFYDDCYDKLNVGGVLVVNLCTDDSACSRYIARIRDSFAEKCIVVDAEDGDNKIVFAQKCAAFPPSFNELTERLRLLEVSHPVDLDRTAQAMLQYHKLRGRSRKGAK